MKALPIIVMALAVVTGAETTSAASAARVKNVAVLPFYGEGISRETLNGLTVIFTDQARKIPGVKVPDLTERAESIYLECMDDPICTAEGLARLGATHILLTTAVRIPGVGFDLNQALFSAPSGESVRTVVSRLSGRNEALQERAFRAAVTVLAPERLAGGLVVEVNFPGARILLDGKPIGTSPMHEPWTGVLEGEHRVTVLKQGYGTEEQTVQVTFNEVARTKVRLTRDPNAPLEPERGPLGGLPIPPGVLAVPPIGLVVGLVVVGGFVIASGVMAAVTFYQARSLETSASQGALVFPRDAPRIWAWRVSLVGTIALLVNAGIGALVVGAVTTAVGVGWIVLHQVVGPGSKPKTWEGEELRKVAPIKRDQEQAEREQQELIEELKPEGVDEPAPAKGSEEVTPPAKGKRKEAPAARKKGKAKEPRPAEESKPRKRAAPRTVDGDLPEGE